MAKAKVTERTFYPPIIEIIESKGGEGVSEVQYNSEPDIIFELEKFTWILSVKIGENQKILKEGFLQYLRHKEESKINFGILLLLPESLRKIKAAKQDITKALDEKNVTAFIDAQDVKEEIRDRNFSGIIDYILEEVLVKISEKISAYYSFKSVIQLLQQQVSEMMQEIKLEENSLLNIITDRKLLSDLGHISRAHSEAVAQFLGSYIFLSQVIFLRLLTTSIKGLIKVRKPATRNGLREAFGKVIAINYKPIYKFDVLDSLEKQFIEDTFDLIWGLEIERVRHELPGRIFHELMPSEIRKMLAAFYTRPQAADLLARLTITDCEETIFDPACGSGTILTAAYKHKKHLFEEIGFGMNPHKRFCENDIYGSDIMPFAVHLTSANLAAMDPGEIIGRTQIIQGDSLRLKHTAYTSGLAPTLFPTSTKGKTKEDHIFDVELDSVDVVLMNPPFTKTERGIRQFVDMETFRGQCGGEVGLWGHFVILANAFLKEGGIYGAVIPINILRGRESSKVRRFIFENWTPLYILKPTYNYGFSEWSEYRDILLIAQKDKPKANHKVKICLIKQDLTKINDNQISVISGLVKSKDKLRNNELVDIDSVDITEIYKRFDNLMWFCGVTDFNRRDTIISFVEKFKTVLDVYPDQYFREGYRPVPKGVSKFMFTTRNIEESRTKLAFLSFNKETKNCISSFSKLGIEYKFDKKDFVPTLRTSVGISKMDITNKWDYIAKQPYKELKRICRASGIKEPDNRFWMNVSRELKAVETNIVVSHRINPFSPATYLNAFLSKKLICPSNQLNVIIEKDLNIAKAVCLILNSSIFFSQFFLLKEESTGRYINIRFYDLVNFRTF